jgi:hypothetical protein
MIERRTTGNPLPCLVASLDENFEYLADSSRVRPELDRLLVIVE